MTDKEIIQGLIDRDNHVTEEFFFVRCRPLFVSIIRRVFDYEVEYNEVINMLYIHLMENDASILRNFEYRSTVYQWIKVIAIRFLIKKRNLLIDNSSKDTLCDEQNVGKIDEKDISAKCDLHRLLSLMPNQRYALVIQHLLLNDCPPEQLAQEMNISVDNLYNIKRRALAQLTQVALNDIREYGKR